MIDATERALLDATVRAALADAAVSGEADATLAELGWLELLTTEHRDALAIVFTALGLTNAAASALDDVVTLALGSEPRTDLAVLLPAFNEWSIPGHAADGRVEADGLATHRIDFAREVLVVCATDAGTQAITVPRDAAEVLPIAGVDPAGGFRRVRVAVEVGAHEGTAIGDAAWETAVAHGRRALGHQTAGACRTMLDLARTHALERVQFGRPVARFQAVRHRLADALVAIEALDAALTAAGDEPGAMTAALAKALAGRGARTVAGHCQQVLAGIGFTTDHPFHHLLKRTMVLDGLFGSADAIALDLGRQLLATRRVPTLIEL